MLHKKELAASVRARVGKGASRAIRRQGDLPAVIYGDKKSPLLVQLKPKDIISAMKSKHFYTTQFEIKVDGTTHLTLCQDVQKDPVSDIPIHADFLRINPKSEITIAVPVECINETLCQGIKLGGVLNVVTREIEVVCRVDNIPESIKVDLKELNIGDSIHIHNLTLPEGVKLTAADSIRDYTVLTLSAPTTMEEIEAKETEREQAVADNTAKEAEAAAAKDKAGSGDTAGKGKETAAKGKEAPSKGKEAAAKPAGKK